MFTVYHSNSLDVLKDLLLELIRRDPLTDPFQAEQILVQSPGMAQWLKLELAQANGIAAALEFPLPASFLWRCFASVLEEVPQRSAFNKESMQWKLMRVLPPLLEQEAFTPLRHYLQDDGDHYRLYQLAQKIADLFDQYLVYRPDWIADWEQGGNLAAGKQPWQPVLWRALVNYTQELQQPHWHRANMFAAFHAALHRPGCRTGLPRRLFVFGISALPQNFIQALQSLGGQIDVHLMVCNPCRYYWGELLDQNQIARLNRRWLNKPGMNADHLGEQGNPLLASLGKLGRDYLYQLQESGAGEIDAFADPGRDSLLHCIQQDILDLDDPSAFPETIQGSTHKLPVAADDHSFSIHSCHSPLREVEVLHNQLLHLFEQDASLQPRQVIVMMPDVAAYAPYIDAVFSSVPASRFIPYSISDQSSSEENPLLLSFARLLQLPRSRYRVSDLLALLEVPALQRRFGIDEAGFQRLRQWVEAVNIRWGLDAEQRNLWDLPAFEQNSWKFGLRRMLAGFALGDSGLWQDIAPYPEIEGLEAELLGQLAEFVATLEQTADQLQQEQDLEGWIATINRLLDDFYLPEDADEIALNTIRQTLQQLQEQLIDAAWQGSLSSAIVVDYLLAGLDSGQSGQRFMVGAVNFCTLMPMRSIPFRVVCLLGMNDTAYPRSLPAMGFDLMRDYPRRGDRSRRDDDRYLFLEAFLAAQERLYISYVGRSLQDRQEKIPSVLVSELLDYLRLGYRLEQDAELDYAASGENLLQHIQVQYPMTAFSPANFSAEDPRIFSYASEWVAAANSRIQPLSDTMPQLIDEPVSELELSELIDQLKQPCRGFFTRRLSTWFRNMEVEALDEEPFLLDALQEYNLKQRYLDWLLAGREPERLEQQLHAEGELPVSAMSQRVLQKLRKDIGELAEKLQPLMQGEVARHEVRIALPDTTVNGWLDACYNGHLVRYRPASVKGRDRLSCWIEHLALQLVAGDSSSYFRGLSALVIFKPLPAEQAREYLQQLVGFYRQSLTRPQAFDANTAFEYLDKLEKGEEAAEQAVLAAYNGGYGRYGLSQDPYIRRMFPDADSYLQALLPTVDLLQPMLAHMEDRKHD